MISCCQYTENLGSTILLCRSLGKSAWHYSPVVVLHVPSYNLRENHVKCIPAPTKLTYESKHWVESARIYSWAFEFAWLLEYDSDFTYFSVNWHQNYSSVLQYNSWNDTASPSVLKTKSRNSYWRLGEQMEQLLFKLSTVLSWKEDLNLMNVAFIYWEQFFFFFFSLFCSGRRSILLLPSIGTQESNV